MALVLGACNPTGPASTPATPDRPTGLTGALVVGVSDGDTITVEVEGREAEVRLMGVNAPERGECFAEEADRYLEDAVLGAEVGLEESGIDQFGRTLAHLWLGDRLVNLDLVSSGMAIAQAADPENAHARLLLEAEEAAFSSLTGLWAHGACGGPIPPPGVEIDLSSSLVDPPGPDDRHVEEEQLTIVNNGAATVDLEGWVLRDESSRNRLIFPPGSIIEPGDSVVVSSGCSTSPAWCSPTPIWNNDGDMALLLDGSGTIVSRARY